MPEQIEIPGAFPRGGDVRDKRVVVTGASRGLGRAIALGLAQHGFTVHAGVRDRGHGAALVAQARGYTTVALALGNPQTRDDEFLLLRVDPAALEAYLARATGAPSAPGSRESR